MFGGCLPPCQSPGGLGGPGSQAAAAKALRPSGHPRALQPARQQQAAPPTTEPANHSRDGQPAGSSTAVPAGPLLLEFGSGDGSPVINCLLRTRCARVPLGVVRWLVWCGCACEHVHTRHACTYALALPCVFGRHTLVIPWLQAYTGVRALY